MSVAAPAGYSPLRGRGILVTRPAARAVRLCDRIRQAGGEAVFFSTLEIISISHMDSTSIAFEETNIINSNVLVFVSPTAVEHGLDRFRACWPAGVTVAAVGGGTARALRERGVDSILAPLQGADSEALAALPELRDMAGRRVVIIRGEGGRAWLADTLRARGARVDYAECYRRVCPDTDIAPLVARWRGGSIAAVTITSRQALDNLFAMLPDDALELARKTPLFAVHARLAEHAFTLGFGEIVTTGAGDDAIVAELQSFFATLS